MNYYANTEKGEEVQYNHEQCRDTGSHLYVRFRGDGWVCHCKKCGRGWFQKATSRLWLQAYRERIDEPDVKIHDTDFTLPLDYTTKLSEAGEKWLAKYGITSGDRERYGIGLGSRSRRVVLPVTNDGVLMGYQTRLVEEGPGTKYLTYKKHKDKPLMFTTILQTEEVIVVEDILSAIKVGRVYSGLALLGSPKSLHEEIAEAVKNYKRIAIWLDFDKSMHALGIARSLRSLGHDVNTITTTKDPKCYSAAEIREIGDRIWQASAE